MTHWIFGLLATPRTGQDIQQVLVVAANPDDCDTGAVGRRTEEQG